MTYTAMAADLLRFLQSLHPNTTNTDGSHSQNDGDISLLGHSMGGKVAMTLALHPDTPKGLLKNLIVEDVSPIKGRLSKEFIGYARAMRRIMDMNLKDRKEADEVLKEIEPDITVRQFLLTNVSASSSPGAPLSFRVPPDIIADSMEELGDFPFSPTNSEKGVVFGRPTLVIRGKKSNYIKDSNLPAFNEFFSTHQLAELDTGHWVHAEDPKGFTDIVIDFLKHH
ncbi:alpha/beta-hydrolase [Serendipita vermifera]|nr:alpha/beta-hydrolase [Serendipita vermifera]